MSTVEENKLRRQSKRLGLSLVKSSAKKWRTDNQMGYQIIDTDKNGVVVGANYELTLEAAEAFLNEYEANMKGTKEMIIFNHDKLEARIIEVFANQEAFGAAMGMSNQVTNSRLKGMTEFTTAEIRKAVELLNLPEDEIVACFFTVEVQR